MPERQSHHRMPAGRQNRTECLTRFFYPQAALFRPEGSESRGGGGGASRSTPLARSTFEDRQLSRSEALTDVRRLGAGAAVYACQRDFGWRLRKRRQADENVGAQH